MLEKSSKENWNELPVFSKILMLEGQALTNTFREVQKYVHNKMLEAKHTV